MTNPCDPHGAPPGRGAAARPSWRSTSCPDPASSGPRRSITAKPSPPGIRTSRGSRAGSSARDDTIAGGAGDDTLRLAATVSRQQLLLNDVTGIETIDFAGFILAGTDFGDDFDVSGIASVGYAGRETDLRAGDDDFIGHAGADLVIGGSGDDRFQGGGG